MARFITRIADLCRQRAAEEQFLRRFRMMRVGEEDGSECGPGWFESSRELERGLQVCEDGRLDEWLEAVQRALPSAP
ncbi:MAG: hypothetical protein KF788_17535 [Piscinibacter sp.]|nr:hypothetical protein [Piscinibacter sp.]